MKSNVSDYLEVVTCVYDDAVAKCTANVSDLRDLETIRSRVESEGLSFLTITLPKFCDDFQKSLSQGFVDSKSFRSFRKFRAIPSFLRGMLSQIFDCETGRIYEQNSLTERSTTIIVDAIRQVCLAFKKMEFECAPARVASVLSDFVQIEQSFQTFNLPDSDLQEFSLVSSMIWDNLFYGKNVDEFVPRHGPGATAERISGNRKYRWLRWHERLERFFPFLGMGLSINAHQNREFELVTFVPETEEQPVRVVTVPKTMKGPRVIAIEPVCVQYVQQAIRSYLYDAIEEYPLTAGHINFRDQSINQRIAMTSSDDGRYATIDLSEASDRVPRSLALMMFRSNPDVMDAIDACRSMNATLPSGEKLPLEKFASMGSALCFPVESMYFYTICVIALLRGMNLPVTFRNIRKAARDVYVYGDDLIVPSAYAVTVLDHLQKYNCKVNVNKTFLTGKFRESCGVDAYAGQVVTPTYIRKPLPRSRQQPSDILSWTATANLFYKKGFWRTSACMFKHVERILGSLPYVQDDSPALGRMSFLGFRAVSTAEKSRYRWNCDSHHFEIKCWTAQPVYRPDVLEGYAALQKCLLRLGPERPSDDDRTVDERLLDESKGNLRAPSDPQHLERSALYGAVVLKRRWVPLK